VPAAQEVHSEAAAAADTLPCAQFGQDEALPIEYVPAAQSEQAVSPADAVSVPEGHAVQITAAAMEK